MPQHEAVMGRLGKIESELEAVRLALAAQEERLKSPNEMGEKAFSHRESQFEEVGEQITDPQGGPSFPRRHAKGTRPPYNPQHLCQRKEWVALLGVPGLHCQSGRCRV